MFKIVFSLFLYFLGNVESFSCHHRIGFLSRISWITPSLKLQAEEGTTSKGEESRGKKYYIESKKCTLELIISMTSLKNKLQLLIKQCLSKNGWKSLSKRFLFQFYQLQTDHHCTPSGFILFIVFDNILGSVSFQKYNATSTGIRQCSKHIFLMLND
jgi:hypothetical protein